MVASVCSPLGSSGEKLCSISYFFVLICKPYKVDGDDDGNGGMWYEVGHKEPRWPRPPLKIEKTPDADRKGLGHFEAGCCGGELVGQTEMTDDEIEVFLVKWQNRKDYFVTSENCIKFGYEFIEKLTDGNFSLSPR